MDIRTIICGVFAVVALGCATFLYATGNTEGAEDCLKVAGAALVYVVGLHSEPWSGDDVPE